MNIIYGLIGATVGRSSGTKEILIEDSIEVKGIFSRSKVQDKHFKEKGYQRFHTKLIRSADHGIVYYIRLSSKAKLVLSYNMDMYPKPYSWEVEKSCGIPENTLLITMKQSCGAHSDQCYLKFFDDKSFQRWQRQLGQILAEINCLYAMKPLQSGMNECACLTCYNSHITIPIHILLYQFTYENRSIVSQQDAPDYSLLQNVITAVRT